MIAGKQSRHNRREHIDTGAMRRAQNRLASVSNELVETS
jgi:hypothetical protein